MSIIDPQHPAGRARLLNTEEVADILGVTPRQVARLRQSGKLKCVRITGAAVRHTPEQLDEFIAAATEETER